MSYTDVFGSNTLPPAGFGYQSLTLTGNLTLEWPYNVSDTGTALAKIMDISCASGNVLTLPDATQVSEGEDFLIRNVGANSLVVKKSDGVEVYTISAGAAVYFYLTDNTTTAGVFGTVPYGVGSSFVDAATLAGYGIKAASGTLQQAHSVTASTSNLTVNATYRAKLVNFTGGAATVSLTDAAELGDDFFFMLRNSGTGTVTIDPSGSQTVDGQSTIGIQPGESLMLFCSGAAWFSVGYGRSVLYQFTQLVKDVSAGGTFTLSAAESSNRLITFIGSPVASVTVVVPSVVSIYYTYNACSTPQAIQVKTSSGVGVSVAQGARAILLCDGSDVLSAQSAQVSSSISIIDGSVTAPSVNFSSQTNSGIYKFGTAGVGVAANGVNVLQLEEDRALIAQPQDHITLSTVTGAPSHHEGRVFYDIGSHSLAYYNESTGVTVNLGRELLARVRNNSGTTMTDGQVVYINGALGDHPTVALAKADSESTSKGTIGVVTDTIPNGSDGYITVAGVVNGLNTSGITEGSLLYLSATTAGAWTTTAPVSPHHLVTLGYVTREHANQGAVFVKVDNGYELGELHDVLLTTPSDGQALTYHASSGTWRNVTLPTTAQIDDTTTSTTKLWSSSKTNTELGTKQATLVSGTNIKTINSLSIVGSGNLVITGDAPAFSAF